MVTVVSVTPKQVSCRCGAVLSYTPQDIKEKVSTDYTGGRDVYRMIQCPVCNKEVCV
ncbi:hypothetical protein JC221_091 [Yersinia phage JC221]|nr:hypothetical protein JC221_091 [Yersinia phage JC221]